MTKRKSWIALLAVIAAVGTGCGSDSNNDSDGLPSAVEGKSDQVQEEYVLCREQAENIAEAEGVDAASEQLDQCVESLADETQVDP